MEQPHSIHKIKISKCYDGDTCDFKTSKKPNKVQKLRLAGIDAPELKQTPVHLSQKSKDRLNTLTTNKSCVLEALERDKYHRVVGLIWCDNVFVNEAMIADGLAYAYVHLGYKNSSFQWAEKAEHKARQKRTNLFSLPAKTRKSPHHHRRKGSLEGST